MTQAWLSPESGVTCVPIFFLVLFCISYFFYENELLHLLSRKRNFSSQFTKIRYLLSQVTIKSLKSGIIS